MVTVTLPYTGVALLAGAPERLPEHNKKSASKAKEEKPTSVIILTQSTKLVDPSLLLFFSLLVVTLV